MAATTADVLARRIADVRTAARTAGNAAAARHADTAHRYLLLDLPGIAAQYLTWAQRSMGDAASFARAVR